MYKCNKCLNEHAGKRPLCNACHARYAREWRDKNRERARKIVRDYQKRNPEKMRENWRRCSFRKNYKITLEQYEAMLSKQKGCCSICGSSKPGGPGRMMVDHNHKTGNVRGLLCCNCNFVIGHSREDESILKKTIAYLKGA